MVKKTFEVTDMSCVVCASNVERTVQALKGVGIAKVNFAANELTVHFDPRIINIQQIKAAVEAAGYGLVTDGDIDEEELRREKYRNHIIRLAAAWAGNRYYVNGSGTSWSIFAPAAAQWGVTCRGIGNDAELMQEALSQGKLVVASMGPGTFTRGGHFIVLTGITDDGKIKVNDPNDNSSKQHINQAFAVSLILRESKAMWVFE